MSGDVTMGSLCSSNHVSTVIENLQYSLGEGPCIDAYHDDRAVLEPDLANPDIARWPAFAPQAVGLVCAPCSGSRCAWARPASGRSTFTATKLGP